MNTYRSVKYWSWLSVFTVSFIFWVQMVCILTN
ncbi:small membrane protein YmiC [Buttiauxella sp. B2]|nr:small membrane protein YmiC [Buttiauxella sp. B2]